MILRSLLLMKLKEDVDCLHMLLKEPEEGLATWCIAVGNRWKGIAELYYGDERDE